MTVKSSISLTDEQAAFARSLVEAGRYSSVSAVLQQALEQMRQKTMADDLELETKKLELEAFRQLIDKRRKGKFISLEEMKVRTDAMIERKRREYGL